MIVVKCTLSETPQKYIPSGEKKEKNVVSSYKTNILVKSIIQILFFFLSQFTPAA